MNNGLKKMIDWSEKASSKITILDCTEIESFETIKVKKDNEFVLNLKKAGIKTFLKSSCVNANILHEPNQANVYNSKNGFCVDCGICR